MKKLIITSFSLLLSTFVMANDGDMDHIKSCLNNFKKHPFSTTNPTFDTMSTKVKVLGVGGNTYDNQETKKPKLVLIKPSVTVLAKTELNLLNPNGWYCLKGLVSVLGKSVINLHCNAQMTSSTDGVTVLGGNDSDNGVTVLGTTTINRIGCENKSDKK